MTFNASGNFRISRQRGFWLRCFLSGAIWMFVCLAGRSRVAAQVEIPGPERLTHVEGIVVNTAGHPVPGLQVMLVRDEKVAVQTRTDKSGEFRFEHVKGPYVLRVERSQYAPAAREIVVTDEIVTLVERKKLYVILGPGACMDECSSVLTSKREFNRVIREKSRH